MKWDLDSLEKAVISGTINNTLVIQHKWFSERTLMLIQKLREISDNLYFGYPKTEEESAILKDKINEVSLKIKHSLEKDIPLS